MTRVLLLGGTGKLGKYVLKELVANRYEVGLLVRDLSERTYDNLNVLKRFEGDITDKRSLHAPVQWTDVIVNCSGYVSYRKRDWKKLHRINVEGVRNIAELCAQYNRKLLHTSSVVVYGSTPKPVFFQEDSCPEGSYKSGYAYSKIEAENAIRQYHIPRVILRPSTLVSREKSTIKNLYHFYKKGFIAGLRGGASFALLQDAAKAYIPALELLRKTTAGQEHVFNLGGNNLTFKELFRVFKEVEPRNTLVVPDQILLGLSKLNDLLLYPLSGRSLITCENYRTGSHFTFVNSDEAIRTLNYTITPFSLSLKEIM